MEPNFHTVNGQKRIRYAGDDGAKVDSFIDNSKTTSDMQVRSENLLKVNALLQDEAYVQSIYHGINLYAYNTAYTGVTRDPGGTFYLKDIKYAG